MGPERPRKEAGDRIPPIEIPSIEERELSRLAREGFAQGARGLVIRVEGGSLVPQVTYLRAEDLPGYFAAFPDLLEGARYLVEQYDAERQYVLVEVRREGQHVLAIREFVSQEEGGEEEASQEAVDLRALLQACTEKGLIDGGAAGDHGSFLVCRGGITFRLQAEQVRRFLKTLLADRAR